MWGKKCFKAIFILDCVDWHFAISYLINMVSLQIIDHRFAIYKNKNLSYYNQNFKKHRPVPIVTYMEASVE